MIEHFALAGTAGTVALLFWKQRRMEHNHRDAQRGVLSVISFLEEDVAIAAEQFGRQLDELKGMIESGVRVQQVTERIDQIKADVLAPVVATATSADQAELPVEEPSASAPAEPDTFDPTFGTIDDQEAPAASPVSNDAVEAGAEQPDETVPAGDAVVAVDEASGQVETVDAPSESTEAAQGEAADSDAAPATEGASVEQW